MIPIDLRKQKALDAHRKAMQQINFTGNLPRERNRDATLNFIITEAKETKLNC